MLCEKCKKEIDKNSFFELASSGLSNKKLSELLGISFSTVCSWKREFRNKGFFIPGQAGRPTKKVIHK